MRHEDAETAKATQHVRLPASMARGSNGGSKRPHPFWSSRDEQYRFAPWLRWVDRLRGLYLWCALAAVVTMAVAVGLLSWWDTSPTGIVGEIFVGLGLVTFWLALLVIMAGWILRRSKER